MDLTEMEVEMEGQKKSRLIVRSMERQMKKKKDKKARRNFISEEEKEGGEKSCIYFVVTTESGKIDRAVWYVIDLNDREEVGGTGLCARRLKHQPPKTRPGATVGSCGSLIYCLGGVAKRRPRPTTLLPQPPLDFTTWVSTTFFYDTANPTKGWFKGPDMISPRRCPSHQVIDNKIYVLGSAYFDNEDYYDGLQPCLTWGEYLEVSPEIPLEKWQWRPVDLPFGFPESDGGLLTNEEYIYSLPRFEGRFNPQRHILCCSDCMYGLSLCYDVDDRLLFKVFTCDIVRFSAEQNVFVDGDYIFAPDRTRVLTLGVFGGSNSSQSESPWFIGGINGALTYDDNDELTDGFDHLPTVNAEFRKFLDPRVFSLVQIAPFKYATLWSPSQKEEKPFVRLSVFTALPPATPPPPDLPLDLLDWNLYIIDVVRANFQVADKHLLLQEYLGNVEVRVQAAVAVRCPAYFDLTQAV